MTVRQLKDNPHGHRGPSVDIGRALRHGDLVEAIKSQFAGSDAKRLFLTLLRKAGIEIERPPGKSRNRMEIVKEHAGQKGQRPV